MRKKIVFIGAGSIIFVKNLVGDCLLTPALQNYEYALLDIDKEKLKASHDMLTQLNDNINEGRALIKSYDDQREALENAEFVINAIHVGGYETVKNDFEIPLKYGLKQTYADTMGMGGLFRGLRTMPVLIEIAKDMEEFCPDALLLNYTNPMAIITGSILKTTNIKAVGLCHSVQVVTDELLAIANMKQRTVKYKVAGINHQAWLLDIRDMDGRDLYPEIKKSIGEMKGEHDDKVRVEIMNNFNHFVTESSQHSAEYFPYFLKKNSSVIEDQLDITPYMFREWESSQKDYWEEAKKNIVNHKEITHERTKEYASYIMEAVVTDQPYRIAGNVLNKGFISNLPDNECVEVPCLVDYSGINPCYVGNLPTQCAALNQTNINMQKLASKAALTGNVEDVYYAAMLDPHTGSELTLSEIKSMCDEMLAVNKEWLPQFDL